MQRLTLTIPASGTALGDRFDVRANVNALGLPTASATVSIASGPLWPGVAALTDWLLSHPPVHSVQTPPLYRGDFDFVLASVDLIGNETEAAAESAFVDSGPRPPRNFRQTGVSSGLPVFRFDCPGQLRRT